MMLALPEMEECDVDSVVNDDVNAEVEIPIGREVSQYVVFPHVSFKEQRRSLLGNIEENR